MGVVLNGFDKSDTQTVQTNGECYSMIQLIQLTVTTYIILFC